MNMKCARDTFCCDVRGFLGGPFLVISLLNAVMYGFFQRDPVAVAYTSVIHKISSSKLTTEQIKGKLEIMWLTNLKTNVNVQRHEHVSASKVRGWRGLVGRTVDAQQVPRSALQVRGLDSPILFFSRWLRKRVTATLI